jgi:hypothetical protein
MPKNSFASALERATLNPASLLAQAYSDSPTHRQRASDKIRAMCGILHECLEYGQICLYDRSGSNADGYMLAYIFDLRRQRVMFSQSNDIELDISVGVDSTHDKLVLESQISPKLE